MAESLTPEEQAQADAMLAQLHLDGYADVDQHKDLTPGARVRHWGHQWPEAFQNGSGTVVAVTEKPDSAWSRSWGMPDVEIVVAWDKPSFGTRLSQVAQYHVTTVVGSRCQEPTCLTYGDPTFGEGTCPAEHATPAGGEGR